MRYARASWVKLNLDEYFQKEKKRDDRNDRFMSWLYDIPFNEKKDTVGNWARKLRFALSPITTPVPSLPSGLMILIAERFKS